MASQRHAYLIIAHTNWEQLQKLVSLLDDKRNDIYVHIDKKSNTSNLRLNTQFSKLVFVERHNVRWGDVSQIKAEMALFSAAVSGGKTCYTYYHLLSGVDLPLHNQDYIHSFFKRYQGLEFIGFSGKELDVKNRVYCHNFFVPYIRHRVKIVGRLFNALRKKLNNIQIHARLNIQNDKNIQFRYGANWVSVTHSFVIELLKRKDEILKMYRYAFCSDEIYKQTFVFNSQFRNKVFDLDDEFHSCMRDIDWDRGRPYTWQTTDDYDYLSKSERLFARKFDYTKYPEIIDRLIEKICNEQSEN